ncbi:MAG: DUF211 domain-containing protein [Candidatus Undinarchaeales archaeon]
MAKKKNNYPVRVVVVDVLKPHKPNIVEFGKVICKEKSVNNANITVYAIDEKTESLKVILEGKDIDFAEVRKAIEKHGAVVHSIDKVVIGKKGIIETPHADIERE